MILLQLVQGLDLSLHPSKEVKITPFSCQCCFHSHLIRFSWTIFQKYSTLHRLQCLSYAGLTQVWFNSHIWKLFKLLQLTTLITRSSWSIHVYSRKWVSPMVITPEFALLPKIENSFKNCDLPFVRYGSLVYPCFFQGMGRLFVDNPEEVVISKELLSLPL